MVLNQLLPYRYYAPLCECARELVRGLRLRLRLDVEEI
jgi:hypothetical protein